VDDYVDCGNLTSLQITNNLSAAGWFKITANTTVSGLQTIVSKYAGLGGNLRSWSLAVSNEGPAGTNNLYVFLGNPSDGTLAYRGYYNYQLSLNTWYYAFFTFSSGTLKLYLNGQNVPLTTGSGSVPATLFNTSQNVNIAKTIGGSIPYYLTGLIDDVRIYNYARSADQIKQDYNAGAALRLGN